MVTTLLNHWYYCRRFIRVTWLFFTSIALSDSVRRDRLSAADSLCHPWLWQLCNLSLDPIVTSTRPIRERSCGAKWAAPPEDPEDKENFLDSPHPYSKRFRFDEESLAAADGDFWGRWPPITSNLPFWVFFFLISVLYKISKSLHWDQRETS